MVRSPGSPRDQHRNLRFPQQRPGRAAEQHFGGARPAVGAEDQQVGVQVSGLCENDLPHRLSIGPDMHQVCSNIMPLQVFPHVHALLSIGMLRVSDSIDDQKGRPGGRRQERQRIVDGAACLAAAVPADQDATADLAVIPSGWNEQHRGSGAEEQALGRPAIGRDDEVAMERA